MSTESNPAGTVTVADKIADFAEKSGASLKSIVKLALQSRPTHAPAQTRNKRIIIMGNGPSLRTMLDNRMPLLQSTPTMAVNFAALSPEFFQVRPTCYTIVDPHFFDSKDDARVAELESALGKVNWPMTLILPRNRQLASGNKHITTQHINITGVEGFTSLCMWAMQHRLGMPRPRNVLIPAIMSAIWMGYTDIIITGADHSWLPNLSVRPDNTVVTVQPHFYTDGEEEQQRVATVYAGVKLHSMLINFAITFKGYHQIAEYARRNGISIQNATPGSFIDAFPRTTLL